MNRKSLIAGLVLTAASAATLAESYEEYNTPFVSNASSAVVQAEAAQARATGVNPWSISYNPLAQFRSQTTRERITAEYIAARDQVSAFTGEDSGSAYLAGGPAAAGETRLASRR